MREIGRQRRLRRSATDRAGRHGGDRRRGVPSSHPGQGGKHHASSAQGLSISRQFFGTTVEPYTGKNTARFPLHAQKRQLGMSVKILTFGGIVQQINVPAKNDAEKPTSSSASRPCRTTSPPRTARR